MKSFTQLKWMLSVFVLVILALSATVCQAAMTIGDAKLLPDASGPIVLENVVLTGAYGHFDEYAPIVTTSKTRLPLSS